jgi:hypothetical protein
MLGRCEDEGRSLGTDLTNGRYGEVWVHTCPHCQRIWLFYRAEFEAFTGSGRWYRAVITPETAAAVTPETAAQAIARSDYRVFGGSFFNTPGKVSIGPGPVYADLIGPPVT